MLHVLVHCKSDGYTKFRILSSFKFLRHAVGFVSFSTELYRLYLVIGIVCQLYRSCKVVHMVADMEGEGRGDKLSQTKGNRFF